jgi:hypothetical protein
MSIYATLWKLKFPKDGDDFIGCDWIEVTAQGVPPHIESRFASDVSWRGADGIEEIGDHQQRIRISSDHCDFVKTAFLFSKLED